MMTIEDWMNAFKDHWLQEQAKPVSSREYPYRMKHEAVRLWNAHKEDFAAIKLPVHVVRSWKLDVTQGAEKNPETGIPWDEIEKLLEVNPSIVDMATVLGMSEDALDKALFRKYNMSFPELRAKFHARLKLTLAREAARRAIEAKGDNMLIFCLRNICGWSDQKSQVRHMAHLPVLEGADRSKLLEVARSRVIEAEE